MKAIHKKTGKIYKIITDNFMFKQDGVWIKNLILYEALYPNPDGKYFARTKEDFNEHFEIYDETIRKEIIKLIEFYYGSSLAHKHNVSKDDMVAWLEKQSDKPQGKTALEAIHEKKVDNANKVEQKFHEDDYIVNNISGDVFKVTEIKDDEYCLCPLDGEIVGYLRFSDVDNEYHLWTIKDAKDGDVLTSRYNMPFIYNGYHDYFFSGSYCGISVEGKFRVSELKCHWTEKVNVHPATKEQRALLFQKMREAGYKIEKKSVADFKAENWYVSKVDGKIHDMTYSSNNKNEKSKWSKEDESKVEEIVYFLDTAKVHYTDTTALNDCIDWIKSIKKRMEDKYESDI